MPTRKDFIDLENRCTFSWETVNGRGGYRVTSNCDGLSIFLPAAGYQDGDVTHSVGTDGIYMGDNNEYYGGPLLCFRSDKDSSGCDALYRSEYEDGTLIIDGKRFCVRPVLAPEPEPEPEPEPVELSWTGLSPLEIPVFSDDIQIAELEDGMGDCWMYHPRDRRRRYEDRVILRSRISRVGNFQIIKLAEDGGDSYMANFKDRYEDVVRFSYAYSVDIFGNEEEKEVVEEEVIEEEAIPFQLVEEKPSFQGGDANAFSKWVNQRLVYPEIAKENGVQGRVTLKFTVEKDGRVTNVRVLRGVDPSLDKEAVRVVSSSPKWTPGKQRGRAVPVTYTVPVIFQLR